MEVESNFTLAFGVILFTFAKNLLFARYDVDEDLLVATFLPFIFVSFLLLSLRNCFPSHFLFEEA